MRAIKLTQFNVPKAATFAFGLQIAVATGLLAAAGVFHSRNPVNSTVVNTQQAIAKNQANVFDQFAGHHPPGK